MLCCWTTFLFSSPHHITPHHPLAPAELGDCNALTNQEAKLVMKQFFHANQQANKLWAPPPLAAKAMEYLDKLEPKTDVQHKETVGRFRE
jgi:hypothetical protein